MRSCCTLRCARWTTIILSVVFLILGIVLAVWWEKIYGKILNHELSVSSKNTQGFKNWQETPIPMYLDFHLFNWTNPDQVEKYPGVKPIFVEIGPYIFHEHHIKENITFNNNDTITFLNRRIWEFQPNMSHGSLEDLITMLNPIAITVTNQIRNEHYLVKRAVNFFLEDKQESLSVTKKVRDILFEGYKDPLIDIAVKLNISGIDLPFTRFAWFVDRNNSAEYDGVFNMYDGGDDISKLGIITKWNYEHTTKYYSDECGLVNGSSGELWYPPHDADEVSIFASDLCSDVKLHRNGTDSVSGIEGNLYEVQRDVFDNGTYFKDTLCFASGMPTGVRDVSACKFGAPAYISSPHFHLADPVYRKAVDGMSPNPEIHTTKLALEPDTGLPLRVYAAFQINLLMRSMDGIDMLRNVKDTLMPCFWFVQRAELTGSLASLAKLLVIARKIGTYTGYGLIGLGGILIGTFVFISYKTGWKSWRTDEEQLITNETH